MAAIINTFVINTKLINGDQIQGLPVGAGSLIQYDQTIVIKGLGTLISYEQTVVFRETGSGTFISYDQTITNTGVGSLLSFEQTVVDAAVTTRVDTAGWDGILTVGNRQIPTNEIAGDLVILRTEDSSALLTVTLRPQTGVQDITSFQGKDVTFDLIESGGSTRLYTGIVDIPEVDLIEESITLRCTTRRQELINSEYTNNTNTVGFYSTSVFSDPRDTFQEIEQRLETIPSSLDFDAYNKAYLTAWQPKSTADYTLTASDLYRDKPEVFVTSRGRIINQVNITFSYRYDRNYNWQRRFQWESPIKDTPCFLLSEGYSQTSRAMVQAAADSTGWPLNGSIDFEGPLPDGWYLCDGGFTAWTNVNTQYATVGDTDENGDAILDENGNQTYTSTRISATDFTNVFTNEAAWSATQRWAQTVSENYTVTVKAPQSITQYGIISRDEAHGVQSPFDSAVWEDYSAYDNQQPAGDSTYFIDRDTNEDDFNEAWLVVINRAKTTILSGHRDNRVVFRRGVWAAIDLRHTVELNTGIIDAKGKVTSIEHRLNMATTEDVSTVEISLSKSTGSQSDSAIVLASRPSDTVNIETGTIRLDNHFGEEPQAQWSGMIGNKFIGLGKTEYPISFTVDAPAVEAEFRDERVLTASNTFNVEIPNDTLTITFDGTS